MSVLSALMTRSDGRVLDDCVRRALSYLETNCIDRVTVFRLAKPYPQSFKSLRRFVGFLALRRLIRLMSQIEQRLRKMEGKGEGERSSGLAACFADANVAQQPRLAKAMFERKSDMSVELPRATTNDQ